MSRPWMPLYVADYLVDTLDLRAEENGVYLLMLMIAWRRPDGALPNDMKWLQRALASCASDMHGNRFNRLVPPLLERFFVLGEDGKFRNKRLTKEREKAEKFSEKQRENVGKRYAANKENKDLSDTNVLPAGAKQSQSQSQSQKKETEADASGAEAPPDPSEPERQLFSRGREVLGKSAGGQIAKLLKSAGGNVALARSKIELAATKEKPFEWIAKVISHAEAGTGPPAKPLTQHQIERQESREILDDLRKFVDANSGESSDADFGLLRFGPSDRQEGLHGGTGRDVGGLSASSAGQGRKPV